MKTANTLKDTIYQKIMNGILSLEYKPNDILTERELIEKYGCSKSPVRDALVTLCNEHVLISHPRYGYEVVRLTQEDVKYILEYRLLLESALLGSSYASIGPPEIDELIRLYALCRKTLDENMWTHWEANTKFHLTLASYQGNPFTIRQLESAMLTLKRAYAQFYLNTWTTSNPNNDVRYHETLIKGLKNHDKDLCMSALRDDLTDFAV